MSTKFDLNKFLQQPKLFTPIDYSGIVVPDLFGVQQTVDNLDKWRKSQGYRTNEEKLQEAQERASATWAGLGNSEDVYDWYNAHQPDPRKQAKFREDGAKTAGLLMTVPLTVASAGIMGWIPALTSTATGFAGAYGGQKLGEAIDNKYGTNTAPWLSLAGGFAGGIGGYKGLIKAGSAGLLKGSGQMYGKQFVKDVIDDVSKQSLKIPNNVIEYVNVSRRNELFPKDENIYYHIDALNRPNSNTLQKMHPAADGKTMLAGTAKETGDTPYIWFNRKTPYGHPKFDRIVFGNKEDLKLIPIKETKMPHNEVEGFYLSEGFPITDKISSYQGFPIYNPGERPSYVFSKEIFEVPQSKTKGSYAWFERPSKLTEAERLGIPKGERNQPIKPKSIQYDVTDDNRPTQNFLDDFAAFKQSLAGNGSRIDITDMFDSPWYKQRLLNQGMNEAQANQLIENLKVRTNPDNLVIVDKLNSVRNFEYVENGIPMGITPERAGQYARHSTNIAGLPGKSLIQLTTNVDPIEAVLHEVGGHRSQSLVSDFKDMYKGQVLSELGEKATVGKGLDPNYYLDWDEVRARALTIAKQMSNAGWNPNSPGQVNVWLNKNILTNLPTNSNQGALYYSRPEFIKAVTTGFKKGGKINPQQ